MSALPAPTGSACGKDSAPHLRIWRRLDTAQDGAPWVCALCHPPVHGFRVEWTDGTTERIGFPEQEPERAAVAEDPTPAPTPVEPDEPELALDLESPTESTPATTAATAATAATPGEASLETAIAKHHDAHLCEIEGEGWIVCPEDDCDRPDHDCRVQRAFALEAAA